MCIRDSARELDILTIAVVTIPSPAEGKKRFGQAMEGIKKLGEYVDSMLVVSNHRLHNIFGDPVSYTHLDVYKRRGRNPLRFRCTLRRGKKPANR